MGAGGALAVEVKPHTSGRDDIARGVYQCVKYRAVLEAESSISSDPYDVSVMLVLGGTVPHEALQLANAFGIPIRDGIVPG
jgi:Asp/Glu/hydantoin racemase